MTAHFLVKIGGYIPKAYKKEVNSVEEGIKAIKLLTVLIRNETLLSKTKIIGGWISK